VLPFRVANTTGDVSTVRSYLDGKHDFIGGRVIGRIARSTRPAIPQGSATARSSGTNGSGSAPSHHSQDEGPDDESAIGDKGW